MKSNNFSRRLIQWFKKNKRDLPWRRTRDPYKIWISEIMLQQTTVAAVIPYYNQWVRRFPTIQSLAKSHPQSVLKFWQGLGYYNRARNLHRASKILVKNFGAKIPENKNDLASLPGFGPYTVGAVLSIAFDQREPIVDANVRRVIMRILSLKGLAEPRHDKHIMKFLDTVMPSCNISAFNQGLMELGALVCRSGQALCLQCPLRNHCRACAQGIQERIPSTKQKYLKRRDVVVAIIKNKNKFFIQKRPPKGLLADLWEFPGGKKEKGEGLKNALIREIREEIGSDVVSSTLFLKIKHFYTQFCINLYAFRCHVVPLPKTDRWHKWVSLEAIQNYPMPSGTSKIVEKLNLDK
ncbi:MAG: A/G-specific adenine glycosylase [Candidatus Omnitrophica bacterium]|nr:A/G-specific adenine glycosylase [Candidatus Omnitrophota bacterium]